MPFAVNRERNMLDLEYLKKNPLQKFMYRTGMFFRGIPVGLWNLLKKLWSLICAFAMRVADVFKEVYRAAKYGNWKTRMSFVVMGFGHLARRQYLRGIMYLLFEVVFYLYFVLFGWKYLAKMGSLGEIAMVEEFNEETGIFEYVYYDNSMLILLYSVLTIFFMCAFLYMWYQNIRTNNVLQEMEEVGKKLPDTKDTLNSMINEQYYKTLLSLPMLGLLLFTIIPIVFMVLIAFTNYDQVHMPPAHLFEWVGTENFETILGGTGITGPAFAYTFREILIWTLLWAFFATFTNYFLGMLVALLINKKGIKFKKLWRTILIFSVAVPQFVSLLLMRQMLGGEGIINNLLKSWGVISEVLPFLTNPIWARVTVIVVNIWIGIPFTVLIATGILMNIPADLYESAKIDGAGPFRTYMKITLPYMWFVTTPYLISTFVGNINNFNVIYLLTEGFPLSLDYQNAGQTDLLITWLYKLTYSEQNYSFAAVIGIITFVIIAVVSLIFYNKSKAVKNEEEFM